MIDHCPTTLVELHEEIVSNLDDSYDLVFVDYRDKFMPEQVAAVVRCDSETLDESIYEWSYESAGLAMWEVRDNVLEVTKQSLIVAFPDSEAVIDFLFDEYDGSNFHEDLETEILDRDGSNPLRDLARNSGRVLLRIPLPGVTEAMGSLDNPDNPTPSEILTGLAQHGEFEDVLNHDPIDSILVETCPCHEQAGFALAYVDVDELYESMFNPDAIVEIKNPHLLIYDPWNGGYGMDARITGTLRVKRSELVTDEDAFGYSWDSVCGLYKPAFECDMRTIPTTPPASSVA